MIPFLRKLIAADFWLKLFSLVLAILVWLLISITIRKEVSIPGATERTFFNIPVMVMSSAADSGRNFQINPSDVEVKVRGDARRLEVLDARDIHAMVDLTGIGATRGFRRRIEVTAPAGVTFVRVVPAEVEVVVPAGSAQ